jgi:hypothetical protein
MHFLRRSPGEKTVTLSQAIALSILGLLVAGIYLYFQGTPRSILLTTGATVVIVFTGYLLFAFYVWGDSGDEPAEREQPRRAVKRCLSLVF